MWNFSVCSNELNELIMISLNSSLVLKCWNKVLNLLNIKEKTHKHNQAVKWLQKAAVIQKMTHLKFKTTFQHHESVFSQKREVIVHMTVMDATIRISRKRFKIQIALYISLCALYFSLDWQRLPWSQIILKY